MERYIRDKLSFYINLLVCCIFIWIVVTSLYECTFIQKVTFSRDIPMSSTWRSEWSVSSYSISLAVSVFGLQHASQLEIRNKMKAAIFDVLDCMLLVGIRSITADNSNKMNNMTLYHQTRTLGQQPDSNTAYVWGKVVRPVVSAATTHYALCNSQLPLLHHVLK